jgi:hypothetical protein
MVRSSRRKKKDGFGKRSRRRSKARKDDAGKRGRESSFVDTLIENARANKKYNVGIGVRDVKSDTLQNFVNEYEMEKGKGEGYAVMTTDKNKIDAYRIAIQTAVANKHFNWFEIGPGADAVLSLIVLESPPTHLFSIEGNSLSSKSAINKISSKYPENKRWIVKHGLTTDEDIKSMYSRTIKDFATACVSELLGMIMSAEYVVDIIDDVQKNYVSESTTMLPRWGATFYSPMVLNESHLKLTLDKLKSKGVGVGVDPEKNWLHASKVPIMKASAFPGKSGVLEFMDFGKAMADQRYQDRVTYFKNDSMDDLSINSLGLWIWLGFDQEPRRGRISKTGYPYGYVIGDGEKYMVRGGPVPIDISSLSDEKERDVVCTNWRNVVMLFNQDITIPTNYSLKVQSICDLRTPYEPKYIFHASVCDSEGLVIDGPYTSQMTTIYSEFQFDQVV